MTLAHEISALETEIEHLRTENSVQRKHIDMLEWENEQLKRANEKALAERDNYLRRSEAIRALLDSTGAMLVNSIKKFHESEHELQSVDPLRLEKTNDRAA